MLNCQALPKKIFPNQLFSFLANVTLGQLGFKPDILNLLSENNLIEFLQQWLNDGTFSMKQT